MKRCIRCREEKPLTEFYKANGGKTFRSDCKRCFRAYQNEYSKTHPRKKTGSMYWRELKTTVLNGYGAWCACCGEDEPLFLTLDHVNGDGALQRKQKHSNFHYKDALNRKFPPDYRVLCFNCNCAVTFKNQDRNLCPHKQRRQPDERQLEFVFTS